MMVRNTYYDGVKDISYATVTGTATITAGDVYVDVTHGKDSTPKSPTPVPIDDLGGRRFWVSDVGATTFRINVDSSDLEDHEFKWAA